MIVTNSLTGGGAERSANLIANYLNNSEIEVCLVPINIGVGDYIVPSCAVFELGRIWKGGVLNSFTALLRWQLVIWKFRPTTVVLNCELPELFGALAMKRVELIGVEHSSRAWNKRNSIGKTVRAILKFRKIKWVAVSNHLSIWPNHEVPDFVIPNPLTSFLETKHLEPKENLQRLVFIGRLTYQKNPALALEIAEISQLPLHVFGDGILRQNLLERSKQMQAQVTFHGQVTNPWAHIRSGDLLLVTSDYEGDGLVLLEGLAMGVPLLVSKIKDLERFELPKENYCKEAKDFKERIAKYQNNLTGLQVPKAVSWEITSQRELPQIGKKWVNLLNGQTP